MAVVDLAAVCVPSTDRLRDSKTIPFVKMLRPYVFGLHGQFNLFQPHRFGRPEDRGRQAASNAAALASGKDENPKGSRTPSEYRGHQHEGEAAHHRGVPRHGTDQGRRQSYRAEHSAAHRPCGHPKKKAARDSTERQRLRTQEPWMEETLSLFGEAVVREMDLAQVHGPHGMDAVFALLERGTRHRNASRMPGSIKRYGIFE